MIEKILDEVKAVCESDRLHADRRAGIEDELAYSGRPARDNWKVIAAYAVLAISEIDAEAENAKYLEQARALLIMCATVGAKYLFATPDGFRMGKHDDPEEAFHIGICQPEPYAQCVNAVARVLRERAK